MDEKAILARLKLAYETPKLAIGNLDWKPYQQRDRLRKIPIACECDQADVTGISIIGSAWSDEPDSRVTFQLLADIDGSDYKVARIDWRPRQPHTNRFGPAHLRGLTLETSIHDFPENADLGLPLMQNGNLPVVKPIEPEPQNFYQLLCYLRDKFSLGNALEIPEPPWSPTLF